MVAASQPPKISPEEYLRLEEAATERHEYHDGWIVAMSGGTARHNRISINALLKVDAGLSGRPCQAYINDVKLRVKAANCYFYPDVLVACGSGEVADGRTVFEDAILIIEVLSDSTEHRDRGLKQRAYRQLPGLQEYVLVAQDGQRVEVFRRRDIGWLYLDFNLGEEVELASVGLKVPIADFYARTDVTQSPPMTSDPERGG